MQMHRARGHDSSVRSRPLEAELPGDAAAWLWRPGVR